MLIKFFKAMAMAIETRAESLSGGASLIKSTKEAARTTSAKES